MRVGRGGKRNRLFDRELNDAIAWIKFVHRFAPAGGGKLDGEIARTNEFESLVRDLIDLAPRPMAVNFNEIQMREAVDQTACRDFAHPTKIIGVEIVDVTSFELRGAGRNAVEHLHRIIEVMDRSENKIELVPILFDPFSSGR